jgi:nicotinamide riboside kinase
MEKRFVATKSMIKIAIIGPECTGKTSLTKQLAEYYNTVGIPEYARDYIEDMGHCYEYNDVVFIAKKQTAQLHASYSKANKYVFFDTDLIITRVWFEVAYKKLPSWIDEAIINSDIKLYLLCATDIPWTPDKVRENGGAMRETLFEMYQYELEKRKFVYTIVDGLDDNRLKHAVKAIDSHFNLL